MTPHEGPTYANDNVQDLSFDTPTMAELYFKQGHGDEALAVYQRLLARQPEDEGLRARARAIETHLSLERGSNMSFREHIQRIVEATPGAVACTIMGFDGIAIDTFEVGSDEVDIPNLLVEYSTAAQQMRRNAEQSPAGAFVEMTVCGERMSAVLRALTEEYFLAVILKPTALVGKARYLMRTAAFAITQELS